MDTSGALRVLVVEDNSALANVLSFNLKKHGFEVAQADNGRQAWELLKNLTIDLVVSDHQMPEMTGIDLCRLMRDDNRLREVPFILVTAKRMEVNIQRIGEELNIRRTFAKPFSPAAIVEAVRDEMSLAR